jgi:hypothetical protein
MKQNNIPELETLVVWDEEVISPEPIVVKALKNESLVLGKQYIGFLCL